MRSLLVPGVAFLCLAFAQAGSQSTDKSQTSPPRPESQPTRPSLPPFPLQLEMRVPFPPTAFPSNGRLHLLYELRLTNFATAPLSIRRLEVRNADAPESKPIATFPADQLDTMIQYAGGKSAPNSKGSVLIASGQSAVVYMSIDSDPGSPFPERLLHQVVTSDSLAQGAIATTSTTPLHVLGPPLEGPDWMAEDGPSNDQENHHRRGLIIFDGQPVISRRYAIDWKQVRDGVSFSGDAREVRSYYSYDKAVLAVADGRVVTARDGLPNNVPGHGDSFHPTVPITLETIEGNTITLDLGGGQFAYYMHLEQGSVRVKAGDRVRRGQLLGRVGCTGDAREPHLHFEVTSSPRPLSGEGMPYLIDSYRSPGSNGVLEQHTRELPLDKSVVVFAEGHSK